MRSGTSSDFSRAVASVGIGADGGGVDGGGGCVGAQVTKTRAATMQVIGEMLTLTQRLFDNSPGFHIADFLLFKQY